jgi:hypothetical protein
MSPADVKVTQEMRGYYNLAWSHCDGEHAMDKPCSKCEAIASAVAGVARAVRRETFEATREAAAQAACDCESEPRATNMIWRGEAIDAIQALTLADVLPKETK